MPSGHSHMNPSGAEWSGSGATALSLSRFDEFMSALTGVVGRDETLGIDVRAVRSSGGAAGGVVSESQGYGVMMAGIVAASLPLTHPRRTEVLVNGVEMFLGWRTMCERTVVNSCQATMCGPNAEHECLPSWKFDDDLVAEVSTGSAPDGDEDAILGMILLVLAGEQEAAPIAGLDDVAKWAYQSCASFLQHLSTPHPTRTTSSGEPQRALKLGSCWGGWDCNNPSYHAPGHFRVFRDYMMSRDAVYGSSPSEGDALAPTWDALIETSYDIIDESQCDATGLVSNWWVPSGSSDPSKAGTPGCSGSGTPPAEFGSEASRTGWRLAVPWLLYGESRAKTIASKMGAQATEKLGAYGVDGCYSPSSCPGLQLDTGCHVETVLGDWIYNGFMLGPVASTLTVPPASSGEAEAQQTALDHAASLLTSMEVQDYYSGSWIAIASVTLNGALVSAGPLLASLAEPVPPSPPVVPTASPTSAPTAVPTAAPTTVPTAPTATPTTAPTTACVSEWAVCGSGSTCCGSLTCYVWSGSAHCLPSDLDSLTPLHSPPPPSPPTTLQASPPPSPPPTSAPTAFPTAPAATPTTAPTPPDSDEPGQCVATYGTCGGSSQSPTSGECCNSQDVCYRQHQWYSQCLPASNGCPAGWECDSSAAQTRMAFAPSSALTPASVAPQQTDRLPKAVSMAEVVEEMAPFAPNLTSLETLQLTLAYVSALLNAQLAHDLIEQSSSESQAAQSWEMAAFFAIIFFCVGVVAGGALYQCLQRSRNASPNVQVHAGAGRQVDIVIDTSNGAINGAQHGVKPPKEAPPQALGETAWVEVDLKGDHVAETFTPRSTHPV